MLSYEQVAANVLQELLDKLCGPAYPTSTTTSNAVVGDDERQLLPYEITHGSFSTIRQRHDDEESLINERMITDDSDSDDEDSEEEFNRILSSTRNAWKQQKIEYDADEIDDITIEESIQPAATHKLDTRLVEHEYDKMPPIEQLSIRVNDDVALKPLGIITSIVDCLVIVKASSDIALDFDSIVFDAQRNAIGKIYDIFGAVSSPLYAIRFNTPQEAYDHEIGMQLFYAPSDEHYTRHVFTEQLRMQKLTDACWDGEGECPEEELVFSDDESEKRFMAKHRRKKTSSFTNGQNQEQQCSSEKRERLDEPTDRGRGHRGARRQRGGRRNTQWNPSNRLPNQGYQGPNLSMAWPPSSFQNQQWPPQPQRPFYGVPPRNPPPSWNARAQFMANGNTTNPSPRTQGFSPRGFNQPFGAPPRFSYPGWQRTGDSPNTTQMAKNALPGADGHQVTSVAAVQSNISKNLEIVDTRLVEQR